MHESSDEFEFRSARTTGCAVFEWIIFIFAGNDNKHESLDEFEIRPDPTTGFYGNRYGYDGKNGVSTFSRLFLI